MSSPITLMKTSKTLMTQVNETIGLNDTQSELEKARFDYDAKLFSLNQEFCDRRDKMRKEYHAKLAEITVGE